MHEEPGYHFRRPKLVASFSNNYISIDINVKKRINCYGFKSLPLSQERVSIR